MFNLVIPHKMFYYLWILFHLSLLVISGYLNKIGLALSMKNMNEFIEVHKHFYPFQVNNISYYDISEFLVYYILGTFFFGFVRKLYSGRKQNYLRY